MNAKTPTERVQELRQRREALGLTRLELYVHPEDHEGTAYVGDGSFAGYEARLGFILCLTFPETML
jgi:hypothetical protein